MGDWFANPVFVALDVADLDRAEALAQALKPHVGGYKLGLEFYTGHGAQGAARIAALGLPLFLDLKFHDIPATVAGAIRSALALKPAILNVHAAGGPDMLAAARDAADTAPARSRPALIAVTLLTSLAARDLPAIGLTRAIRSHVFQLAAIASHAGLDGVVCSGHEIASFRKTFGPDFRLVVPGLRPEGGDAADQKRVMTPEAAWDQGADVLVIGRPITQASDPAAAAAAIVERLRGSERGLAP